MDGFGKGGIGGSFRIIEGFVVSFGVRLLKGVGVQVDGIGELGEGACFLPGRLEGFALEVLEIIDAVSLGFVFERGKGRRGASVCEHQVGFIFNADSPKECFGGGGATTVVFHVLIMFVVDDIVKHVGDIPIHARFEFAFQVFVLNHFGRFVGRRGARAGFRCVSDLYDNG